MDAAAQAIIDEHMADSEIDLDDLDWVEPLLDEARAEVGRGVVVAWDEVKRELGFFKSKMR